MEEVKAFFEKIWNSVVTWFIDDRGWAAVLTCVLVALLGLVVIKIVLSIARKIINRTKMKGLAGSFLITILKILLFFIYIIAIMKTLGIDTSGVVAVLAASSLAVSLALQTVLSNFASGMILIGNHPFKEGDFVEVAGISGVVKEITLFSTKIQTVDNKMITVPNSSVASDEIINYSELPTRRVDMEFTCAYGSDIEKVKGVIVSVLDEHEKILKDSGYTVRLARQADSALVFNCRFWVNNADYWEVFFDINEAMTKRFEAEGIQIPYNTVDVNVVQK